MNEKDSNEQKARHLCPSSGPLLCLPAGAGWTSTPAVIYDRAYRTQVVEPHLEQAAEEARNRLAQTETQPPSSFRRRPESSGLFNTFPQSGNDKRVTPAGRGKSQSVSHPDSAPLDSSIRWNDGEGCGQEWGRHGNGAVGMAINPFLPPSSFQRRPESTPTGM